MKESQMRESVLQEQNDRLREYLAYALVYVPTFRDEAGVAYEPLWLKNARFVIKESVK